MAKFQNGIDLWKIRDKGQLRNYVTYKRNYKLDINDLSIVYDTKKIKTAGPKCISAKKTEARNMLSTQSYGQKK